MRSTTSYDTKLNPHEPSLGSCAWLCRQSALVPGAFFYYDFPFSARNKITSRYPTDMKGLGFGQLSSRAVRSRSQIYGGPPGCYTTSG